MTLKQKLESIKVHVCLQVYRGQDRLEVRYQDHPTTQIRLQCANHRLPSSPQWSCNPTTYCPKGDLPRQEE